MNQKEDIGLNTKLWPKLVDHFSLLLSYLVYNKGTMIRDDLKSFIEDRQPVLKCVSQVIADLGEQERIIYEYYATENYKMYKGAFNKNLQVLNTHKQLLLNPFTFSKKLEKVRFEQVEKIELKEIKFDRLLSDFEKAMQAEDGDWNEIRALLLEISQVRRDMLESILPIEDATTALIMEGNRKSLKLDSAVFRS